MELVTNPIFVRAVIGGILIAIICATMGVFLTLRKESFLAEAVAHASLAGVAIAFAVGAQPFWLALIVGIGLALLITYVKEQSKISSDTAIGIFFPVLFAVGILILSSQSGYRPELQTYLFGSLLAIGWTEVIYGLIGLVLISVVLARYYKQLVYSTFDPETAFIRGIAVKGLDYLVAVLSTICIIIAVRAVGIVLVTAFIVIPAASARLLARRFGQMIPLAITHNVIATLIGVLLAPNLPPGAMIVVVSGAMFVAVYAWQKRRS